MYNMTPEQQRIVAKAQTEALMGNHISELDLYDDEFLPALRKWLDTIRNTYLDICERIAKLGRKVPFYAGRAENVREAVKVCYFTLFGILLSHEELHKTLEYEPTEKESPMGVS